MRRLQTLGATTVSLLLLAGVAGARDPNPPMPPGTDFSARVTNPWFPLLPGTRSVYVGVRDGQPMRDVDTVLHSTRTIDGVACAVVQDRSYLRGRLHERTTDWYSQDRQGNVWYLGEDTAELDRAGHVTSRSGSWLAGRDGAVAGIFMPAHPRAGQSFRQEYYKGQAEDHFRVLTLYPTGSPNGLLTEEWTPLEPGTIDHKLYVRGVGTVLEHTEKGGDEHGELVSDERAVTAAVEACAIRRRYGSLVAVDDLSFAVEPGEILGVLGPNGAGKTTALRILTTILEPQRGSFTVAGLPHTRAAAIRSRIGVLPESAGYPERQTGEEHLRYTARLFGQSRASARGVAARLLGDVGLGGRGGHLIATYSRGMRQRLGIARALVNDPEVVFLDEPTLGLDPAGQRQVLQLVRRIASERGATVMLSTHLLAEVEETCSRVLILHRGRLLADGTVADVVRQAAAPRVATLRIAPEDAERARAALSSCGVPVRSLELEGARLSDAFLELTEAG